MYYDCAHSQLQLKHLSQIKNLLDGIIDQLKKRRFESKQFIEQINVLIDMDMLQQSEYIKLQSLFKQNGNIMTEACKLIHHLDDFTWHSDNMIKTVLEYYNVIKTNRYQSDTNVWEEKRKALVDSPKTGRTVAILNNSPKDETIKVTFNVGNTTANSGTLQHN